MPRWSRTAVVAAIGLICAALIAIVWTTQRSVRDARATLLNGQAAEANAIVRARMMELEDLPSELCEPTTDAPLTLHEVRALEDVVRDYILAALEKNDGNQTHTAQQLKIGSATLYRKLKRYGRIGDRTAN